MKNKRLLSAITIGIITGVSFTIVFDNNIAIGGGLGILFGITMYMAEKPKNPKDK
ncbi:hypothetical protein [Paenibacillus etheri]|uniref:hypothetical protein n=1 Tax=Paenibacillus etheri TaxID=1306852 RepID=UPI000A4A3BA8|nr:hypothetical protein [Paenibacillus etheri]